MDTETEKAKKTLSYEWWKYNKNSTILGDQMNLSIKKLIEKDPKNRCPLCGYKMDEYTNINRHAKKCAENLRINYQIYEKELEQQLLFSDEKDKYLRDYARNHFTFKKNGS